LERNTRLFQTLISFSVEYFLSWKLHFISSLTQEAFKVVDKPGWLQQFSSALFTQYFGFVCRFF